MNPRPALPAISPRRSRTRPRIQSPVVLYVGIVLAALGACRGGTDNPVAPTIEEPPVHPTTTFQGVIVGMNEIGSVDMTIETEVTATRLTQVQSPSHGTLRLAGATPRRADGYL